MLATVKPDGSPHAVPIVHVVEGDRICFAVDQKPKSSRNLQRLENISHQPRVAVLFEQRSTDWDRLWWARADGTAVIHRDRPALAAVLEARHPHYAIEPPEGPWVVVTVERWSGWAAR